MQVFLYARVSTADQTIGHQKDQAEASGYAIHRVIEDEAVSGVTTRFAERQGGARLLDLVREGDIVVVRWVDRLGRDYSDVTDTIRDLMRRGVIVRTVINNMTFDGTTKDPMQQAVRDALIGFMAATAQAQAEATKEAQKAGIAHAKARGVPYKGRKPSYDRTKLDTVIAMLGKGAGTSETARAAGVSRQTVLRIKSDKAGSEAALVRWAEVSA